MTRNQCLRKIVRHESPVRSRASLSSLLLPAILALAFESAPLSWALEDYALAWSTYFGGASSWEQARDVCVDKDGNVLVVGGTASTNFPTTPGAYDRTFNAGGTALGSFGPCDVFVAKFDPSGQLLWATYLGSPNYDRAYAVEVDAQGFIYVAGRAGPGFPVTSGAVQATFQGVNAGPYGMQNAFVAKLAPDGSNLVWATYLGVGAMVRDFALDSQGNICAALGSDVGSGNPPAAWFTNAYQKTRQGGIESGVVKLSNDGSRVLWASWFGGSGDETSEVGVRVDAQDRVFIAGDTKSTDLAIVGAQSDASYNGGWDGFLAVFSPDGSRLLCSTYLGGSGDDYVLNTHALAVDAHGNAYVHFGTLSANFPTTPGALKRTRGGPSDIGLAKIETDTGQLLLGTYIGGSGDENPDGLYVDADGNVFLTAETTSANFPVTTNAFQRVKGGGADAVLVRLSADFSSILYATFLGGTASDKGRSGFLDADGSLYMVGTSSGPGFPVKNAWQPNFAGGSDDAIVAKFIPPNPALRILSPQHQSGSFDLLLTNLTEGIPYTVQRTESLSSPANWSNVFTWTANTNARSWDESAAGRPHGFYRARSGTP